MEVANACETEVPEHAVDSGMEVGAASGALGLAVSGEEGAENEVVVSGEKAVENEAEVHSEMGVVVHGEQGLGDEVVAPCSELEVGVNYDQRVGNEAAVRGGEKEVVVNDE
ncbi:unnamed protein product [Urochloa humidicola]